MACEIFSDPAVGSAFYDPVAGVAFGPVMTDEEWARAFKRSLGRHDPRRIPGLREMWGEFRESHAQCAECLGVQERSAGKRCQGCGRELREAGRMTESIFDVFRFLEDNGFPKVEQVSDNEFVVTHQDGRSALYSKDDALGMGKKVWSPTRAPIILSDAARRRRTRAAQRWRDAGLRAER